MKNIDVSKQIAYLLRHNNDGLKMDSQGYVRVVDLLVKLKIDIDVLDQIIVDDKKGRYSYSNDRTLIRANQGHSLNFVKIDFEPITELPDILYHGTSRQNWKLIKKSGVLSKMSRTHVHLSKDIETAKIVGLRYAKNIDNLIIIKINSQSLIDNGIETNVSANGVYLTDNLPIKLLWI